MKGNTTGARRAAAQIFLVCLIAKGSSGFTSLKIWNTTYHIYRLKTSLDICFIKLTTQKCHLIHQIFQARTTHAFSVGMQPGAKPV
jgi:hypothetical protein